ncbi:serine/threonine-protein kinase [Olsenella sp. Marseille-P4559]|uniref:serine/threonine protein kinase n=1 Tax=Olsenella sp. Marseille-P4559 TaxID=2364795 RepID=UPI0013EF568E|nr:serine/threonine-protein kinase [Olsenella sp. Marseille-P4559]
MSVDDSYHVEHVLARGQEGITDLVTLDGTGPFVRKRIPATRARRGVWAALPEIDCARLPHIEATYEMPDEFIVVYDYVPGETVEQLVESRGKLDSAKTQRLVGEVCQAASKLHAHDIVHRDITPSNVVVAADGAHLIDFGIARLSSEDAKGSDDQLGTWGFAAPEQYGFAKTDARSDVYSIGRLLGYLLTGVHPEDKEGYEQALASPDVSAGLRAVVLKATEFEPSARYQSAAELERALQNEPREKYTAVAGPDPHASAGTHISHGSHRARTIALVCAITASTVVIVLLAIQYLAQSETASTKATSNITSSGGATSVATPQDKKDAQTTVDALSVGESHWSVSNGSVYAEFSLTNNSKSTVVFPSVTITGYAGDGSVLFSDEQFLLVLAPGDTAYQSTALDGSTAPARVEFTPNSPTADTLTNDTPPSLSTANISARADGLGGITVSGTVTLDKDGSSFALSPNYGVCLTAILRDASGNIVGGGVSFLSSHPKEGSSMPFDVHIFERVDFATCEVHALPW